jgi:hypothetical protein
MHRLWVPDLRDIGLSQTLKECSSYGIVNADVYYDEMLSSDSVVFDLLDGGDGSARRIDPVHLLMQFSSKLDLFARRRVILARNGTEMFFIEATNLRELADSYAGGGRIWAFNNLPARVRTMDGGQVYGEWTGGWLGVTLKQTEDMAAFLKAWVDL